MFWFLSDVTFGNIVGVSTAPVVSNLPTHIPDSSSPSSLTPSLSSSHQNAGWVIYSPTWLPSDISSFDSNTISISCSLPVLLSDNAHILYLYLGIQTKYANMSDWFTSTPVVFKYVSLDDSATGIALTYSLLS